MNSYHVKAPQKKESHVVVSYQLDFQVSNVLFFSRELTKEIFIGMFGKMISSPRKQNKVKQVKIKSCPYDVI